jgi:hypothetical protein
MALKIQDIEHECPTDAACLLSIWHKRRQVCTVIVAFATSPHGSFIHAATSTTPTLLLHVPCHRATLAPTAHQDFKATA